MLNDLLFRSVGKMTMEISSQLLSTVQQCAVAMTNSGPSQTCLSLLQEAKITSQRSSAWLRTMQRLRRHQSTLQSTTSLKLILLKLIWLDKHYNSGIIHIFIFINIFSFGKTLETHVSFYKCECLFL